MITVWGDLPRSLSPFTSAVLLMVLATLLTSIGMVMNKYMVLNDYSPAQIIFWRSIFSMIPLAYLVRRQGGYSSLKSQQISILTFRGFMGFASMMAYCFALKQLSIFTAESLLYLEPIFVFIMAVLILREKIQGSSYLALGFATFGVLLIVKPGPDMISLGSVFAILSAFFYATEVILTRFAGSRDSAVTMFAYYSLTCLVGSGFIMCFQGFAWPALEDYFIFILIALVNLGINLAFTEALRRAPASKIAPLEYLTLAWVCLWQIQIWGVLPKFMVATGALMILLSGLWILKTSFRTSFPSGTDS